MGAGLGEALWEFIKVILVIFVILILAAYFIGKNFTLGGIEDKEYPVNDVYLKCVNHDSDGKCTIVRIIVGDDYVK